MSEPDIAASIPKFYDEYDEIAIPADAFAQAVALTMSQPEEMDVNEILFRPTRQDL